MVLPNWMTLNENQAEGMANERTNEGENTTSKSGSLALENGINISIRNKSNLNITIDSVYIYASHSIFVGTSRSNKYRSIEP